MDHYPTPPLCYDYTSKMFDFLLDIIFPRFCVGCGKMGRFFCKDCSKSIRFYSNLISADYHCPKNLDGIFVLAHYDGIIREAIKDVKYKGHFAIFKEIVAMMPRKFNFEFDYLVPVPLHKNKLMEREFNQAEKLAKEMGYKVVELLVRNRETKPQFDLKREEREKNVKDAFEVRQKIPAGIFCLVDDVATTGSTLSECAKVLKNAGAKKVYAIVIARGN